MSITLEQKREWLREGKELAREFGEDENEGAKKYVADKINEHVTKVCEERERAEKEKREERERQEKVIEMEIEYVKRMIALRNS